MSRFRQKQAARQCCRQQDVACLLKRANAHIHTEPPNWSDASSTRPDIEAVGENGSSGFLDVPILSVQASGASSSLSAMLDSAEKSKRDMCDSLASQRGATFVSLVMEANAFAKRFYSDIFANRPGGHGGWSKCGQKYLNKIFLRYAMSKGVTAMAAKTHWRVFLF